MTSTVENEALDALEKRLSQDGYTLIRRPRSAELPPYLHGIQPDAIAIGRQPSLLIEVISRRASDRAQSAKIAQLQSLLVNKSDWKLHVVYIKSSGPQPTPASAKDIEYRLGAIRRLSGLDPPAGLVMAWSLLEASARLTIPQKAGSALTPATTVELLASLGHITQAEAELLREAGRQRNLVVHGDLTTAVSLHMVDTVLGSVEAILTANPTI